MSSSPLYSLRVPEVFRALESSPDGLGPDEVDSRRSLYGSNLLSEKPPTPSWRNFLVHISHPMAGLLILAGLIAFQVSGLALGIVIWLVVLANAGFSFWREYRAEQAMVALRKILPAYARVLRQGVEKQVPASELVPGDVLILAEGDNIPADARIIEAYGLRTNDSILTGDSVPARKSADASLREGISEVERPNLIFAGSSIVSGTGRAVVYAIGMLTQFGRIANLTQSVKEGPSSLQRELIRITRIISIVAIGIGVIVFVVGFLDNEIDTLVAFLLALGIVVAVIPEGLPATVTLSLAMAGQRLAQHGVLVKKLSVVETLGMVSVICTDKSGTLTQNQMTVREVWIGGHRLTVSGVGYEPRGDFFSRSPGQVNNSDLQALLNAAMLCNNSRLKPPSQDQPNWSSLGDQTEAALRVLALKGGITEDRANREYLRIHELPFDARRKRMSTIHRLYNGFNRPISIEAELEGAFSNQVSRPSFYDQRIAFVKGAPREILQLCTKVLVDGSEIELNRQLRVEILKTIDEYSRNALRVLALAQRELPHRTVPYTPESVERDLTFLGLTGMMDPPRPEVARAVEVCRQAGIRMIMITGDYGLTAESIARRVGLLTTPNPVIITGAELDTKDDHELQSILEGEAIFARMAPEHKLRLVAAFQARGDVVAVTGDGVNDVPALRKADVGVSMGMIGTDVAKEASDVILTQDNFSTIVTAIEEGRAVYANLRKFITYIFSSNVPEVLPFIMHALFSFPLILTVAQILAIDLGTDLFPALALGTEKPEIDVMLHPPRLRTQPLLDSKLLTRAFFWQGTIEAILCYIGFFLVYGLGGLGNSLNPHLSPLQMFFPINMENQANIYSLAITVYLAGVVMAQIGNAFACRTETAHVHQQGWFSNQLLLLGILAELLITILLIYFPPLAKIFNHRPIPLVFWVWLILYAPILYGLEWIRKSIVRGLGK
jgi:Ca2+-transporting ATPase